MLLDIATRHARRPRLKCYLLLAIGRYHKHHLTQILRRDMIASASEGTYSILSTSGGRETPTLVRETPTMLTIASRIFDPSKVRRSLEARFESRESYEDRLSAALRSAALGCACGRCGVLITDYNYGSGYGVIPECDKCEYRSWRA